MCHKVAITVIVCVELVVGTELQEPTNLSNRIGWFDDANLWVSLRIKVLSEHTHSPGYTSERIETSVDANDDTTKGTVDDER
jgi:hypothetical protein